MIALKKIPSSPPGKIFIPHPLLEHYGINKDQKEYHLRLYKYNSVKNKNILKILYAPNDLFN